MLVDMINTAESQENVDVEGHGKISGSIGVDMSVAVVPVAHRERGVIGNPGLRGIFRSMLVRYSGVMNR